MLRFAACDAGHRVLTIAVLGTLAALVSGCSGHTHETINEREYASYRSPGTAVIVGQVTLTLKSGEVLDGAACQVRLSPVTTETTKYMQEVVMAGDTKPWKADADSVWWIAQADEDGRFRFEEVPSGSYYLTCPVAWHSSVSGEIKHRILWAEATLAANETATVSISR
jgi:hypothetical protein